jgi:bifunctional non-homologous end joining protein LigD
MIAADAHELARALRPQAFGRTRPTRIDDAIVEPAWPGLRVIAAVSGGTATLWNEGERVDEVADVSTALTLAITASAEAAIFEGYLTRQILSEGIGVRSWTPAYPTMTGHLTKMLIGGRRSEQDQTDDRRAAELSNTQYTDEDPVNLVIVDLLWLDGQWLLDVPLLERKRVLESILKPGRLVRPGLFVRYPIDSWMGSWRAQGFRGVTFKAANSRYRPGETAPDWTEVDIPRR